MLIFSSLSTILSNNRDLEDSGVLTSLLGEAGLEGWGLDRTMPHADPHHNRRRDHVMTSSPRDTSPRMGSKSAAFTRGASSTSGGGALVAGYTVGRRPENITDAGHDVDNRPRVQSSNVGHVARILCWSRCFDSWPKKPHVQFRRGYLAP